MNIDKLLNSNKQLEKLYSSRINSAFKTTTGENMIIPVAASLASGIICHNFQETGRPLEYIVFAVMLISWILSGFLAGFLKKWYHIIFCAAFNLLPFLFFNAGENTSSEVNKILVSAFSFTSDYNFEPILNLGINAFTAALILTAVSGISMLAGFYIRKSSRSLKTYCRLRVEMLNNGAEN